MGENSTSGVGSRVIMTPSETSSEKIILSDFSNRQWAPTVGRYLLIGITNLTRNSLVLLEIKNVVVSERNHTETSSFGFLDLK
jgi:hypothetical protein